MFGNVEQVIYLRRSGISYFCKLLGRAWFSALIANAAVVVVLSGTTYFYYAYYLWLSSQHDIDT